MVSTRPTMREVAITVFNRDFLLSFHPQLPTVHCRGGSLCPPVALQDKEWRDTETQGMLYSIHTVDLALQWTVSGSCQKLYIPLNSIGFDFSINIHYNIFQYLQEKISYLN